MDTVSIRKSSSDKHKHPHVNISNSIHRAKKEKAGLDKFFVEAVNLQKI